MKKLYRKDEDIKLPNVKKDNYLFMGWYYDEALTQRVDDFDSVEFQGWKATKATGNIDLYAKYSDSFELIIKNVQPTANKCFFHSRYDLKYKNIENTTANVKYITGYSLSDSDKTPTSGDLSKQVDRKTNTLTLYPIFEDDGYSVFSENTYSIDINNQINNPNSINTIHTHPKNELNDSTILGIYDINIDLSNTTYKAIFMYTNITPVINDYIIDPQFPIDLYLKESNTNTFIKTWKEKVTNVTFLQESEES